MAKGSVQIKKENMGWMKEGPCCGNGVHFSFEEKVVDSGYGIYMKKKKLRCTHSKGGYAIKLRNWCKYHEFNEDD